MKMKLESVGRLNDIESSSSLALIDDMMMQNGKSEENKAARTSMQRSI